ncbi:MAG TPA: tetratricopeptide repeat protein [Polyangiaceae bacterium]
MPTKDHAGYLASGADAASIAAFEQAADEFRSYAGDPVATVDRALAASPAMVMAHALKAWLFLLGTEPEGLTIARACLESAQSLPANERERGHLEAIRHMLQGRFRDAGRVLEDVNARYPLDALALQAGHLIDFFVGDSRLLRDRLARVLPAWAEEMPAYPAVLGMYAFGLEECGEYARAEELGRASVALDQRGAWSWHAVAHVLEMQNRTAEGIAWLGSEPRPWADGLFAIHNFWHLALFHLELGDFDEVLRLYDGPIYGQRSRLVLDMIDASAMLFRLALRGVDAGERWKPLADNWAPHVSARNYAFNDYHAMMAFVGTGDVARQEAVLESLRAAVASAGDNAAFSREVGLPAALAVQAFGRGDYAGAVKLLRPIRSYADRFGGSHAQRDLLDLMMLEAALRAGETSFARALSNERRARRPESPLSRLFVTRSEARGTETDPRAA